MPYKRDAPCGWEQRPAAPDLDELHGILKCAAERGCRRCVECSEEALTALSSHIKSRNDGKLAPTTLAP